MSYLQIHIGGKLRGLKFNQGTLIEFQSLIETQNIEATSGYALIYSALKSNAFVKREEFVDQTEVDGKAVCTPITFEQVCDWVDELPDTTIADVLKAFQESTVYQNKLKPKTEEEKKNITPLSNTEQPATELQGN